MLKAVYAIFISLFLVLHSWSSLLGVGEVRRPVFASQQNGTRTFSLPNGSTAVLGDGGLGKRLDQAGRSQPFLLVTPQHRTAVEAAPGPSNIAIAERLSHMNHGSFAPGEVIVVFRGVDVNTISSALARRQNLSALGVQPALAATFSKIGARSILRLFRGTGMLDAVQPCLITIGKSSPSVAASELRLLPSVVYASPNYYVSTLHSGAVPIPAWEQHRSHEASRSMRRTLAQPIQQSFVPSNYAVTNSLQSLLNANATDAVGAFQMLGERFGQLPGTGEIITNVSVGDLTDQSMADAGDGYVQDYGPTSVIQGGQRYLDIPSMPLIPTYTADSNSRLDPLGSTENQDPFLGEVLLDFSMMAPLPHNQQRGNAVGVGDTDLLGIAPGAQYRLIVPKQTDVLSIDAALIAAARQVPRPNVITASLGFGTDGSGFPGRYLEDDYITQAIVASIVKQYGIVVVISSNDGTRLFTNVAVNPDGGSTPTNVIPDQSIPTSISDDAESTTPSLVFDSGAIAAGGSTLDDTTVAQMSLGGPLASETAFAETRLNGSYSFSSGFGSRVNLSAPSDNVVALVHVCLAPPCSAQNVIAVLDGGTSASAPEIAAASAIVLQTGRLVGKQYAPADVRNLLEQTARVLPDSPQVDRALQVGPQIDVSSAVRSILGPNVAGRPEVVRVAISERQNIGNLGGSFLEVADPTYIDLTGPLLDSTTGLKSGLNNLSPITIAPDWVNIPEGARYALMVSGTVLSTNRWTRILPAQILRAAGLPFLSSSQRTVTLTYRAMVGHHIVAGATFDVTFSATDGKYIEAQAPIGPSTIPLGKPLTVTYDLTGLSEQSGGLTVLNNPTLVVSSIGHWNPITAPYFRAGYSLRLTSLRGTVTIPASAFAAGAGIYGVGIMQNPSNNIAGEFAPVLVAGTNRNRPDAPTLSSTANEPQPSHALTITRGLSTFFVHYDVTAVPQANSAVVEISAPGPTLGHVANVFTNAFGSSRDLNGIDSGSVTFQYVSGVRGTLQLDAQSLHLISSMAYTVRILPAAGVNVIGEASPVSSLYYLDAITPGGAYVDSFDINPSGTSSVGTLILGPDGTTLESAIFPYTVSSEAYADAVVDDPSGQSQFYVFGSDNSLSTTAAIVFGTTAPTQQILSLNMTTATVQPGVSIDPSQRRLIVGAMVDQSRHRLALLTNNFFTRSAAIVPYDLNSRSAGPEITIDNSDNRYLPNIFDIDRSTGTLLLANSDAAFDNCIVPSKVVSANFDTGAVLSSGHLPACMASITSDQRGQNVFLADGALETEGRPAAFRSRLYDLSESSLQQASMQQLPDRGAYMSAIDPINNVMLQGTIAPDDLFINNNALSAVEVLDLRTGQVLNRIESFNFMYPFASHIPYPERDIQLDPATRTAYTYGPYGDTIQQFSY